MTTTTPIEVDLYSDTVTRPTQAMRRFMCDAEVGDEQKGEDPTVNQLQEMVAELLGKEAAVFLPSGTMCNEIAMRVHCRPGDEMLAHRTAHPIHYETGGPAALAGVNVRPLDGARGQFDASAVEEAVRPDNRYFPRSRLLWVEQTSNLGGGSVWPLSRIESVVEAGRRHGLATHMDGARLMNAVVASGISARSLCGAVRLGVDRLHQGPRRARRRGAGRARARSSPRRGATSSRWAGPCARPGSSRRAACTPFVTTSSAWPRTTRSRVASPRDWPSYPGSSSIPPTSRPTSCSST